MDGKKPRCKPSGEPLQTRQVVAWTKGRKLNLQKNCGVFWEQELWDKAVKDKNSRASQQPPCDKKELMVLPLEESKKVDLKKPLSVQKGTLNSPLNLE